MQDFYDVVVVGGSSAGSYFARRMAERGFSVLVLEKNKRENTSRVYDIFHIAVEDFEHFSLPKVTPGDGIFAFHFQKGGNLSPFGNHFKATKSDNIGMHKHAYIQKLNDWAMEAGAEYLYEASFDRLVFTDGRISGVVFRKDGETVTVGCRLCADCSGIPSVVRRTLPDGYGVSNAPILPEDTFFVKLRYIRFREPPKEKWLRSDCWLYYKIWLAPSDDDADGILGIGSCESFEAGDEVFKTFLENVNLPAFDVVREERGITPYHAALDSFVGDGFVVLGDAASVTKPTCGEGVTAALVAEDAVIDAATQAMKDGAYPTKEALWRGNKVYNSTQGKDFALMYAIFARALRHSVKANEYMFKNDIIFSEKITGGADDGIDLGAGDVVRMLWYILRGFATKDLRPREIKEVFKGGINGLRLSMHYDKFPETPEGYESWKQKADRLWQKAGRIADKWQ